MSKQMNGQYEQRHIPRMYEWLQRLNSQRHLYSIRTAFISIMPIMIVGAYAVVINNLPIPAYQQTMENAFGPSWRNFGVLAYNITTQVASLLAVYSICSNLTQWYNTHRKTQIHSGICGMIGLACYFAVSLPVQDASSISFTTAGVNGLFVAMLTGIVAGEAFIHLCGAVKRRRIMGEDSNSTVPQAFESVIPAVVILFAFAIARMVLVVLGIEEGLSDIVMDILRKPYETDSDSVGTAILYNVSTHLMWIFGIHGNNVLDGVAKAVFTQEAGATGKIVVKTFFDTFVYMGGSGTTLGLLLSLMLFSRGREYRTLYRFALPNAVFNINEPLIFGIPIVLNPIYVIPFVLTPCVMFFTSYLAIRAGLVPQIVQEVSWATPIFISGYVSTGSFAGIVLQLINLAIAVGIYTPFMRISESLGDVRFKAAYKDLVQLVTSGYSDASRDILARPDDIGAVARRISNQLDSSITNGSMFLQYQPIVDPRENKVSSVEALLRWRHPLFTMVNPMVTVALAEEGRQINKLGLWVIDQAVRQRAQWTKEGLPEFVVSVNISTQQLNEADFYQRVLQILRNWDVPPAQLQLEITEAMAMVDNETTQRNIRQLSQSGVSFAMDDFGVGHSSLLYLRSMPIDTLKIDGSLTREIGKSSASEGIIATIYDLCRLLNIKAVIEFVETVEQLRILEKIGDFCIQGYYYSPALPSSEIPSFVRKLEAAEETA